MFYGSIKNMCKNRINCAIGIVDRIYTLLFNSLCMLLSNQILIYLSYCYFLCRILLLVPILLSMKKFFFPIGDGRDVNEIINSDPFLKTNFDINYTNHFKYSTFKVFIWIFCNFLNLVFSYLTFT